MAESGTKGQGLEHGATPARDLATEGDDVHDHGPIVLRIGSLVGRYVVLERLGAGGMGVVYAAFDPDLDRKIALKLMPPRQRDGDRIRREERLIREAKAIAKLSHPNIVAIFDVGLHQDQVFMAMECLAGGTLKRWLTAERRPWREIVRIFVDAGRGLATAHAEGLVHRDFKPENVLLDKNGVAKVVDFGLVRLEEAADPATARRGDRAGDGDGDGDGEKPAPDLALDLSPPQLTRTGSLLGTPAYMAPEQFNGHRIDARSDQFAFCASLYEALYGERPFAGETVSELAKSVTSGELRPAPAATSVPVWIRRLLARGLARDAAQRHASVADLLQALLADPIARRRRRVGLALALVVASATVIGLQRHFEQRRLEFDRRVSARLAEGVEASKEAKTLGGRVIALRNRAFAAFDSRDHDGGEKTWAEARAASEALDAALERAQHAFEAVLAMDQDHAGTRRQLAAVVFERATLAEREFRREDLARHLAALDRVDAAGEQRQKWRQPGALSIRTDPAGARVKVERFEIGADSRITAVSLPSELATPVGAQSLPPGSYRLHLTMPGRAETLYPIVIKRGEPTSVDVSLPPAAAIPADFTYVPAGRFLYGDHDEDWRLSFLNAVPIHERVLHGFLIKAHETTFGEWIEFLSALPARERSARLPASNGVHGAVALTASPGGRWTLRLVISQRPLHAAMGEKIVYPGRGSASAAQDWLKMPVVGVSVKDIQAYLSWLAATGKVPGARLCTDAEWERAARGADEREYPGSLLRLAAGDANVDATYGRIAGAYGPDEVGRHPASRSPFGVDDMAGNVWEVVSNDDTSASFVIRSGCYYEAFKSAQSTNREFVEIVTRSHIVGFRVCADLQRQIGE